MGFLRKLFRKNGDSSKESISFLVGSGFSIPDKIMGVKALNQVFQNVKKDEIFIGSSQESGFLDGEEDANNHLSNDKRLFIEEFINFYIKQILKNNNEFDYEVFFDFVTGYAYGENVEIIDGYCKSHNEKYPSGITSYSDPTNRMEDIKRTISQLIAHKLGKESYVENCVSFAN